MKDAAENSNAHPLISKSRLSTLGTVTKYTTGIVILLFLLWIISTALNIDATLDPFFFPVKEIIFILWIMFVVVNIILMGLHGLRVKWTSDEREALWHISNYGNGAKGVIAACIVLVVIFGYPPIMGMVDDAMDQDRYQTDVSDFSYKFTSGDPLDISRAERVEAESDGSSLMNVSLYTKESVDQSPDWSGPRLDHQSDVSKYEYDHDLENGQYYIRVTADGDTDVEYRVYKGMDPVLLSYFLWFPMVLLAANIAWIIYLFVARQRVIRTFVAKEQAKMQKAFTIEEVFLIYRDGRLIAHNTRRLKADVDKDILTGMLTAVQNFVAESFQKDEEGVLDEMHYGNFRVLIENGEHANMAVVVHGEEPKDMRRKMKSIIKEIHEMYGSYLASWDGDTTALKDTKNIIGEITTPTPEQQARDPVEEVFLLHRDNRFIYHVTRRLGPDVDDTLLKDTVDYVQERVGPTMNASISELPKSLPYGEWMIALEYAPDVFLAALLSGPEPKGFRDQMEKVLEEVTMTYGDVLYQWNGEMEGLTDLRKVLETLFIKMKLKGKRRRR